MKKWSDEIEYGEVSDFGTPVINLESEEAGVNFLPADKDLSGILGWESVYIDDEAEPYKLLGIAEADGQNFAVFSRSRNLALGKDYDYVSACVLTDGEAEQVVAWITDRREKAIQDAETARQACELIRQEVGGPVTFKAGSVGDKQINLLCPGCRKVVGTIHDHFGGCTDGGISDDYTRTTITGLCPHGCGQKFVYEAG